LRVSFEADSRIGMRHGRAFGAIARPSAILALLLFLVACGYAPGDVANPLTRKFTWVSFLGGDDIRAGCVAGAPDRFRLIYNGVWREQARVYELGFSGPRSLDQRVIEPGQLFAISIADPLGPWRGSSATTVVALGAYDGLIAGLEQSGAFTSPTSTLTLKSTDFYWVASSCHAGTFHLTGWRYPSDAFGRLSFPQKLLALDTTRVPFNPPRPWTEVASAPLGTADNPARGGRGTTDWSIGIANDQLVDQAIF
jgi:hypothetical protein